MFGLTCSQPGRSTLTISTREVSTPVNWDGASPRANDSSPVLNWARMAFGSGTTLKVIESSFGLPRKYSAFATSWLWLPVTYSFILNGPVPTGDFLLNSAAVLISWPFRMCFGTMPAVYAMKIGSGANDDLSWNLTVDGSTTVSSLMAERSPRRRVFVKGFRMLSKVNLTSSAENGVPSCHLTSLRSVNVQLLPSGETSHFSARSGAGLSVCLSSRTN